MTFKNLYGRIKDRLREGEYMTNDFADIIKEIRKFDVFSINDLNYLIDKYGKVKTYSAFKKLLENKKESSKIINKYVYAYISINVNDCDCDDNKLFELFDMFGEESVLCYFKELIEESKNPEEVRKKYKYVCSFLEDFIFKSDDSKDNSTGEVIEADYGYSEDSIKMYIKSMTKEPLLTLEKEREYFSILKEARENIKIAKFEGNTLTFTNVFQVVLSIRKYDQVDKLRKISEHLTSFNKNIIDKFILLWKKLNGKNKENNIVPSEKILKSEMEINSTNIEPIPEKDFDEQLDYIVAYISSRKKITEANSRLVISIAKMYCRRNYSEFLDLCQEGMIGLMRAIDLFDLNKGNKFSTYATWWIRQAITRSISDKSSLVRIPVHIGETLKRYERAQRQLSAVLGRDPSNKEIADFLKMNIETINEISKLSAMSLPISLETPSSQDDGSKTIGDFIPANTPDPEEVTIKRLKTERLRKELNKLDPKYRYILEARFGINDEEPKTLNEIGEQLGITRERVRQIINKSIRILKRRLETNGSLLDRGVRK